MITIVAKKILMTEGMSRRERELEAVRRCLQELQINSEIKHRRSGAPFLDGDNETQISITHSQRWAAIAVAQNSDGLVGIDIESADRGDQLRRVMPKVAAETEKDFADNVADGPLKLWTAKEAAFKALGRENVDFANHLLLNVHECDKIVYTPDNKVLNVAYKKLDHTDLLCIVFEYNNFEVETL